MYDAYALTFFLFDPAANRLHFLQVSSPIQGGSPLEQHVEDGYLPIVQTTYRSPLGVEIAHKVLATTVGPRQRSVVLSRLTARLSAAAPRDFWLCVAIVPAGPSGFQRHDRAGRYIADRRITFLRYIQAESRAEVNASWGPVFDTPPAHFGLYGNPGSSYDPSRYLADNPFQALAAGGSLNGQFEASDHLAGLCSAVFAWPMRLTVAAPELSLNLRLPVDDYRGAADLAELRAPAADDLEQANRAFWTGKLDRSGLQAELPQEVRHLFDLFRLCRANLLILSDQGEIHPGPTVYDSFWIRDSSVEGVACALAGDQGLAERQFGEHYPTVFNIGYERIGPVSAHGFFGAEHEKNDQEWDSNGQALWAIGRFDRIIGAARRFGAGMFAPYMIDGARWIRDNRCQYGLLHSGWSAEHIGDKDKPHFWDDMWGLAGLWEAARLAQRIGAPEAVELWAIYDDLRNATANSMRWVLGEQGRRGFWETFIPTGPGDVGRLDSTVIGAVAYFHPCRLYMGAKLGDDIDYAMRMTLNTIWGHFMDGGFRHDSAWNCYGPYLTLQLAHALLLIGDVERMDQCLAWSVGNAGYARINRPEAGPGERWQVVTGAWNEQHCYPIAKDFAEFPSRAWYMGDIPHGWACAELLLLLRDMLFFEADEDGSPHIYLAPGFLPRWFKDGESVGVSAAPTIFGGNFGFRLTHRQAARSVEIDIHQPPPVSAAYIYPCRFGSVRSVAADGVSQAVGGNEVRLPAGTRRALITYG